MKRGHYRAIVPAPLTFRVETFVGRDGKKYARPVPNGDISAYYVQPPEPPRSLRRRWGDAVEAFRDAWWNTERSER